MPRVKYGSKRGSKLSRKPAAKSSGANYAVARYLPKQRIYGMMNSNKTVYPFKRTTSAKWTMNTTTGFGGLGFGIGMNWSLSQMATTSNGGGNLNAAVPNYTELQNLFDQWRISKICYKIYFSNSNSTTGSTTTFLPTFYVCNDQDNGSAPSALTELQQRPESKLVQLGTNGTTNNIREFTLYPNCVTGGYTGSVFTGYADMPRNVWCDTASPDIKFYGAKFWWDTDTTTNTAIGFLTIVADIYFEFRGVQ